jgi:hypothetical protein
MISRCSRRAVARGLLAVVLLLCVLRGGVREGPEVFVDLRFDRRDPPETPSATADFATPASPLGHAGTALASNPAPPAVNPGADALPAGLPLLVGEKRLSLMLPIGPAVGSSVHGDHARLSVLLRSLAKFFILADLDALVIVTPDTSGVTKMIASIAKTAASAKLDALLAKSVVIADGELVPEVEGREKRGIR